jgi:hypothetical protein
MRFHLAHVVAWLAWTGAACTSSNPASVGSDATSGDADASCPLSARTDLPTGACVDQGCIEVQTRLACPDGTSVEEGAFACSCVGGSWSCEPNGGFNLNLCPDAGADATKDADTADACPASTTWFEGACRKLCLPGGSTPSECTAAETCDMSAGCFSNCDPADCSTVCWGVCAPVRGD